MSLNSKPKQPPDGVMEQLGEIYRLMASNNFRPGAPSDGFGNITGPLDLEREIKKYAQRWWGEEDEYDFYLGCCDFRMRPAVVLAVEAIKQLNCGIGGFSWGVKLLRLALREAERARVSG